MYKHTHYFFLISLNTSNLVRTSDTKSYLIKIKPLFDPKKKPLKKTPTNYVYIY